MSSKNSEVNGEDIPVFPEIVKFIDPKKKRLIDGGLYFYNASLAGRTERYTRARTSHTIHVWWARRPFSAMRPLVFASLCKINSEESKDIMSELSNPDNISDHMLERISKITGGSVLDMFGGGGTIPLSAQDMGFDAYAIDINPLSVFIQRSYLEYFQKSNLSSDELISLVQISGERVLDQLAKNTQRIFPERERNIVAYLWTYEYTCKACNYNFLLSKRPWIDKKSDPDNFLAVKINNSEISQRVSIVKIPRSEAKGYSREYRKQSPLSSKKCPKCAVIFNPNIQECKDVMIAEIENRGRGLGKEIHTVYSIPDFDAIEKKLLRSLDINPNEFNNIPKWSGITNPTLYGIENYFEFLNSRQRIMLLYLISILEDEYTELRKTHDEYTVKFVLSVLSSLIDQLVDWNSRISMWISENMQVGRGFSGPGVPMYWDYTEIDPVLDGPANLYSKLNRIIQGISSLPKNRDTGTVIQASAQNLPFEDNKFDAIVTDPPYYDNLYYSVLADFFYSWKRLLFRKIDDILTPTKNSDAELVASKHRSEDPHSFYVDGMTSALREAERVLKEDGVISFVYSHSSINGWAALAEAINSTGLIVSSVQPLTIERKARPRGMNAASIDSCLVLVMHHKRGIRVPYTDISLLDYLKTVSNNIKNSLNSLNWLDEDIAYTIFANAIGMIANLKNKNKNKRSEIIDLLIHSEIEIKKLYPSFKLQHRKSI